MAFHPLDFTALCRSLRAEKETDRKKAMKELNDVSYQIISRVALSTSPPLLLLPKTPMPEPRTV